MTPDDELPQAFATLTDHLRDEIGRQIDQITAELAVAALTERDRAVADATSDAERRADARLAAALEDAETRRIEAEARAREDGRQIGIEEGRFEGYEQGKTDAFAQAEEERLRLQHLDDERRAAGPNEEAAVQAGAMASARAEAAAGERLADAIRALDRARSLSEILDTLASCAAREAERVGIVLAAGGRFRGWRFIGFNGAIDEPNRIDFADDEAGVIAEAARSGIVATADAATSAPPFAARESGCATVAVPLVLGGEAVAVLYGEVKRQKVEGQREADEDRRGADDARSEPADGRSERALEILARHASRCLESVTAFKAARLMTERPDLAPILASGRGADNQADEDAAALRYARLLVSEIRLYHEPEIVAGRRDRDLATRLGGEISRARVLYEQRVPAAVRARGDYFHSEVVRTLANGDETLV